MYLIGIVFSLLAAVPSGLKIEEVIAHESVQQGQDLTVEENLHEGKVLVLSDGSTWVIAPQSLKTSQAWIVSAPLKIEKVDNPTYNHKISSILQPKSYVLAYQIAPYKTGGLNIDSS